MMKQILLFGALLICVTQAQAQFNLVSGYDVSFGGTRELNRIIDAFDADPSKDELNALRAHHAFKFGIQYRYDLGAIELAFLRSFSRKTSENLMRGEDVGDLVFSHGITSWMLAVEFGKTFLVGGSLNYHRLRYFTEFDRTNEDLYRKGSLGTRLYLGLQSNSSSNISVAIKPYVQLLWSDINLEPINRALNPNAAACDCTEMPFYFGLSLTIQNGPQG